MTPYFFQIRNKEQILYTEQFLLNPRSERQLSFPASVFNVVNGGVLTISLYRGSTTLTGLTGPIANPTMASQLLVPQGELLFFKRANSMIRVEISTDRVAYVVGQPVTYTLNLVDTRTNVRLATDAYVSVVATDDTFLYSQSVSKRISSQFEQLFIENELTFASSDRLFTEDCALDITDSARTGCIEHVLAIQPQRLGIFDLSTLLSNSANYLRLPRP